MKKCSKCCEIKPRNCFSKLKKSKDGLQSKCKDCANKYRNDKLEECRAKEREYAARNKEARNKYKKEWNKRNPDYMKKYHVDNLSSTLICKYGITLEEYNKLLEKQNNSCAICKTHKDIFKKRLAVDHCHFTGKVRGLLCDSCNHGLGKFKDSTYFLDEAINYLNDPPFKG